MEYMKPAGTLLKWKDNTVLEIDETISPTFEDHILLTALLLMDKRLPAKIKTIYGPKMEFEGVFLMDLASEIFNYVSKIIDEDKKAGLLLAANSGSYDDFDSSFVYYPDMGLGISSFEFVFKIFFKFLPFSIIYVSIFFIY